MATINLTQNTKQNYINDKFILPIVILIGIIISLILVKNSSSESEFPKFITDPFTFSTWINFCEDWMKDNYRWFTRMIAGFIKEAYYSLEDFLIESPWLFILSLLLLPSIAAGGLRLGLLVLIGTMFWGIVGMWDAAMQTLALMGLSVFLSVIFGVITGIICSQSDRAEGFIRPILDTMQVMPAFVYLLPAVFFFGIGGPPAIMATMIYALPPVIRLTNLGIRQVPSETIESATSFGSNRLQLLFKIKIPLALPSIMMGINQTIMMALGLVVLATFIGAEGLGTEVWRAIYRLKVGWAFEGGMCILFMAIMFDRFSLALSKNPEQDLPKNKVAFLFLPQNWDDNSLAQMIEKPLRIIWDCISLFFTTICYALSILMKNIIQIVNKNFAKNVNNFINKRVFLFSSILILIFIWVFDKYGPGIGAFPDSLNMSFRKPVDVSVAWLTVQPHFIAFTKGLRAIVYLYLLHPLDIYLTHVPWWYTMGAFVLISWISVGVRFAIVCAVLLAFIGACDLWMESMITLSSVLVSVLICFIFGVPLGIAAAYSKRFDIFLRPILDAMQTLPVFCYLIPVLMFFGGNIVSAVIATVIYSLPPMVRLTTLGLSQVSVTVTEVSQSFGGTGFQTLRKIKLPMALPSLVMGFNQAVMMAFAMQVVTPLIGGKGLGRDVFGSLAKSDTGKGLAAGLGIVLLAVIMDRLSQAWTKNQRKALGL